MKLQQLRTDDAGVSPVIGVILMVAVTVTLAAVIGAFVMGMSGTVSESPQAGFSFEYTDGDDDEVFDAGDDGDQVVIKHKSGSTIDASRLTIVVEGTSVTPSEWSDEVTAGDAETISDSDTELDSGDTISVIWSAPDNEQSTTLESSTAP